VTHHDSSVIVWIRTTPGFVDWMNNVSCPGRGEV
jgi:hypothetical protein